MRDRNWLDFSVGIELDLFFCRGPNRLRFCVRAENYLVQFMDRNWLSFCAGDRNWHGFRMLAKNHLISVWASSLTSFLCGWSKLTWFQCEGTNLTWFQCRDRNWLGLGVVVKNDLVLVFGSKLICCWYGDQNWLVLVREIRIDLVFVWGPEMNWF